MKNKDTIAAYVHIPFCLKKCPYCAFASEEGSSRERTEETIRQLRDEIKSYSSLTPWNQKKLHSLFFGGGTPSLLEPELIESLISVLDQSFGFSSGAEVTIEVNPETVQSAYLKSWQQSGINRISMGVQSLNRRSLDFLGRIHSVEKAHQAYEKIREAGFNNVSIDLIYGFKTGHPIQEWEQTLEELIRWNPEHISAYSLIIEEGTPFHTRSEKGEELKTIDSIEARQYEMAMDILKANGYKHYEVSNWAKPGYECTHNISYWDDSSYLGLGPSAHGYDNKTRTRYWNYSSVDNWKDQVAKTGNGIKSSEILTPLQWFEEQVMLGLRMVDGIKEELLIAAAEEAGKVWPPKKLEQFINNGFMVREDGILRYTRKGLMLANTIEAELTS